MDASGIYPQLIIRFPYAAPFEFCIALVNRASEPPTLDCSPCPRVPMPACPLAASPRSCPRVTMPTCPLALMN